MRIELRRAKAKADRQKEDRMRVVVEAFWDNEASVWVASARGDLGLVTEADTIEALQQKLAGMVRDLLPDAHPVPLEIELVARSVQTLAA